MRAIARWVLLLLLVPLGGVLAVIGLELGLRALPVTKGLFRAHDATTFPLPAYEPDLRWTHSIGWDLRFPVHGRTNNYGQVSPFDYQKARKVTAVIGDSFVEGQLNAYPDTLQGRLAATLRGSESVYSFGIGGNSLSDYAATTRIVSREFDIDALVFYIVDGDIRESFDGDPGHYRYVAAGDTVRLEYVPLPPLSWRGRLLRRIGESSLLFYVFANLRFQPHDLVFRASQPKPAPVDVARAGAARNLSVIAAFLDELQHSGIAPQRIVLVLDSDRYALYRGTTDVQPKDDARQRALLAAEARGRGFQVIDMAPIFAADWQVHRTHFDYYPLDRHLDGYGNALIARAIAQRIEAPR
jgi:hypothetical protein